MSSVPKVSHQQKLNSFDLVLIHPKTPARKSTLLLFQRPYSLWPQSQLALCHVLTVNPRRRADISYARGPRNPLTPAEVAPSRDRPSCWNSPLQICTMPMMMMRARASSLPAVNTSCTLVAHLTLEQFTHVSSTGNTGSKEVKIWMKRFVI